MADDDDDEIVCCAALTTFVCMYLSRCKIQHSVWVSVTLDRHQYRVFNPFRPGSVKCQSAQMSKKLEMVG